MSENYFITIGDILKKFDLEKLYFPQNAEKVKIYSSDINRPGLSLAGFFEYFDDKRIQIYGRVEHTFMSRFTDTKRSDSFKRLFSKKFPLLIITRDIEAHKELLEEAKNYEVPVLRTQQSTSEFMSELTSLVTAHLAPRMTIHGVLVEVCGEGVLIMGESGVGKSETAIELVKRGHLLISDDAVEIRKVASGKLIGTAPEVIRHFIELRGIGIINIKELFGAAAIKEVQGIDLIINLELWDNSKHYERLGIDSYTDELLGVSIPSYTVPVRPGRDIALIVEVAAMNNRQRRFGYNAAHELNKAVMENMEKRKNDIE